jgi:hypothetical protein
MALHAEATVGNVHIIYNWTYADTAAREAATGFVSGDVGKMALQSDNNSLWMLTATTPTWNQVNSSGLVNPMTTAEDIVKGGAEGAPERLEKGASGSLLGITPAGALAYLGGLQRIARVVVAGADADDITFSSIPAVYDHLLLEFQGRGTKAATYAELRMQLNADNGSNYDSLRWHSSNSGASAAEQVAAAYLHLGYIAGASSTAGEASGLSVDFHNYSRTTFWKTCTSHNAHFGTSATGSFWNELVTGNYRSTSAISSIKLYPDANKFLIGSVATLYGLGY